MVKHTPEVLQSLGLSIDSNDPNLHGNLGVFASKKPRKEANYRGVMVKNAGDHVGDGCSSYCNQKVMHLNVTDPPMHGSP